MIIVSLTASFLALLFVYLSVRVITLRRSEKIGLGTGGHIPLERAIRVQANFSEYVPLTLLLLALAAYQGASALVIGSLCGVLIVARCAHAYGVSQTKENYRYRTAGMAGTLTVLIAAAVTLCVVALRM